MVLGQAGDTLLPTVPKRDCRSEGLRKRLGETSTPDASPAPGVFLQLGEAVEGIGAAQFAGVDQAPSHSARVRSNRASWSTNDVVTEINDLLQHWYAAFGDSLGQHANEAALKVVLTPEILRRWFGEAMLQQAVHIADLQRASVVDLLRLLDYPNRYIPVLTRRTPAGEGDAPQGSS
jgi:hypothetical protein